MTSSDTMAGESRSAEAPDAQTGVPVGGWRLEQLLANRRWVRRRKPFPHVVAADVFVPSFYRELEQHFRRIERDQPQAFARNMPGYDASGLDIGQHLDGPLALFASREWHDMIERVAGVGATGDVNASLHHHDPGSQSGWPHNDLNPVWFAGEPAGPEDVVLSSTGDVAYQTGPTRPGAPARNVIRAVSLLFYLANPPWQPGDGGETALYSSMSGAAGGPAATVPPVNNSLVLFECTPFSYHSFLTNRTQPRNSVVMWLHRERAEVVARWGEQSIANW